MRMKLMMSARTLVVCLGLWCAVSMALVGRADTVLLEEYENAAAGSTFGITYAPAIDGQGAVFARTNESRIQYPFESSMVTNGTLEWWIKVDRGYHYQDYLLVEDEQALIFTTDIQGGDVTWPGSTWLRVYSNGTIRLTMATTLYGSEPAQEVVATNTSFRFNEWHAVGISFGSGGQHIMVDGQVVGTAPGNTQWLGCGGGHVSPVDIPTIGESVSCSWGNNRYEGGFEGMVDRFRISSSQSDWNLARGLRGGLLRISASGAVEWATQTNWFYSVQQTTNLFGGAWTKFITNDSGDGNLHSIMASNRQETVQFFRVLQQQFADYLVVDLAEGPSATNYPVSYLTAVPSGGWSDDFKTTKLAFRLIPAGTFTMGSPTNELGYRSDEAQHEVTLSQPFYVGVFEVTQQQWERVMGTWPSYYNNVTYRNSRPVEQVSYNAIRGTTLGTNWPANSSVDADSFMGRMRERTGKAFDLPTEAQWEYAGRAGTTTALNSGYDLTSTDMDAHVAVVGRYWYNGGLSSTQDGDTSVATAKVGSYLPNAWGLYDIHGNVWEWCLDWFGLYHGTVTDPAGPAWNLDRVSRGGCLANRAYYCRVAHRYGGSPNSAVSGIGFRAAVPPGQP